MNTVLQGLYVTVVGMGLVFMALGILLAAMVALDRSFRASEAKADPPSVEEGTEEDIVAIATAMSYLLAEKEAAPGKTSELGASLRKGLSPWAAFSRGEQLTIWKGKRVQG